MMNQLSEVFTLEDIENKAKKLLPAQVYGYFSAGADDQEALRNNKNYYNTILLMPRVLRDISSVDLTSRFLGQPISAPFGASPVAMQKLLHPQGQILLHDTLASLGVPYTLSSVATTSLSKLPTNRPQSLRIMQMCFLKEVEYTKRALMLAEQHGYKAIAITLDNPVFGRRRHDVRVNFSPDVTLQVFKELGANIEFNGKSKDNSFIHVLDSEVTWDKIKWIRANTPLKLILKGIINVADVATAHQNGADAVWISNHGGRQLSRAPPTASVISSFRAEITRLNSKMELYVDGGVRSGTDIFKALALGADFVFMGRPMAYSLVLGKEGVQKCYSILLHELKTTMALTGCRRLKEINERSLFRPKSKL